MHKIAIREASLTPTFSVGSNVSGGSGVTGLAPSVAAAVAVEGLNDGSQKAALAFEGDFRGRVESLGVERNVRSALSTELVRHGFSVVPVDPKPSDATGYDLQDADAVLLVSMTAGYEAPNFLNSFCRDVYMSVYIYRVVGGKPEKAVFSSLYRYKDRRNDPYCYLTIGNLSGDLPRAVGGVQESLLTLTREFGESLDASLR